ncbi:MAG: hypothetical protein AAGF48_13190 [Pseudomonadota bacterium]
MRVASARIPPTVERMTGRDDRRADILAIGVADAHPPIMRPLAVEIAFYGSP